MHKNNSIDHGIVAVDSNLYNTKADLKQTKTRRKQQIIKRTEFNSCTVQVKTRQGTYHTLEKNKNMPNPPPIPPPQAAHRRTSSGNSNGETQQPIGLGARIAQNIEMAKKGYEQLVHAIIRPPRATYRMDQLGPTNFTFLGQQFQREDVELLSSNTTHNHSKANNLDGGDMPTCSFLRMQVSIWTRVGGDNNGNDDDDNAGSDDDKHKQNENENENENNTKKKKKNTMIVYLHGNASARVEVVPNLSFLLGQVGVFGVVGVDFTGSGKSDGEYVSLGYYERTDLDCVIQHLQRVYGSKGSGSNYGSIGNDDNDNELEIIIWGRSMGASTALMYAGKNTANNNNSNKEEEDNDNDVDIDIDDNSTDENKINTNNNELNTNTTSSNNKPENTSCLKGMICDSPFASLTLLCEELVERARQQGVVVPGVIVSVAIAMIARSVRLLANFNIREINPLEDVSTIDIPALFIVGADDDFIPPHHSERLIESYKSGVTTNLFMVPGGHNDARPKVVFEGIGEFCKQRLSIESGLEIPPSMVASIHQNPPWAYHRTIHYQEHTPQSKTYNKPPHIQTTTATPSAADAAAEELGMTKDRQDDIQNKIGMMMLGGGQGQT